MSKILISILKFYKQSLSPALPGHTCRFYPSCSSYAIESLQRYGTFRGILLTAKRLLKCHPLHPGGFDPVP